MGQIKIYFIKTMQELELSQLVVMLLKIIVMFPST